MLFKYLKLKYKIKTTVKTETNNLNLNLLICKSYSIENVKYVFLGMYEQLVI